MLYRIDFLPHCSLSTSVFDGSLVAGPKIGTEPLDSHQRGAFSVPPPAAADLGLGPPSAEATPAPALLLPRRSWPSADPSRWRGFLDAAEAASNGSRTTRCDHDPQRRRTPRISARPSPHGDIRGPQHSPAYNATTAFGPLLVTRATGSQRLRPPRPNDGLAARYGALRRSGRRALAQSRQPVLRYPTGTCMSTPPQCPPASHDLPST
jgi:hypothetical protein